MIPRIVTLIGTRPEIIKMSPLLPELDRRFRHVLVHSGQHYSEKMDAVFFEELDLRPPDIHLGAGSGYPGLQTARILQRFEEVVRDLEPAAVIVHGDTNTTLAGAIAACKYPDILIAHVEAGARSGNGRQTEEINRLLVDRVSHLLFAATQRDAENLLAEGIPRGRVVVTGNSVVESCRRTAGIVGNRPSELSPWPAGRYGVVTMHRQETVDDPGRLRRVVAELESVAEFLPLIFPIHPRTRDRLERYGIAFRSPSVRLVDPLGYRDMIALVKNSRICLTDSGGLAEETAVLRVPALILRTETEHVQYIAAGMHRLTPPGTGAVPLEAELLCANDEEYRRRKSARLDLPTRVSGIILDHLEKALALREAAAV